MIAPLFYELRQRIRSFHAAHVSTFPTLAVTMAGDPHASPEQDRDHLFISYAWEDAALADWLVRKLTALGYRVWCDRFKLLGGERWPVDIDHAIKSRSYRMLALISKHSIEKENPLKERQLALALSKERHESFLIPLNLDGSGASSVGWQLTDLTWVPFANWADGLAQLLQVLEKAGTPRPLAVDGPAAAIATFIPGTVVTSRPERLFSNCFPIVSTPLRLSRYRLSREPFAVERAALALKWPCYKLIDHERFAFSPPPPDAVTDCATERIGEPIEVASNTEIDGVPTRNIISSLVKQSLFARCVARGMHMTPDGRTAYFPPDLVPKDKIPVVGYRKRATTVKVIGERKFGKSRTRYHLGVAFSLRDDILPVTVVQLKIRLHIVDPAVPYLVSTVANTRRKAIAKAWWNNEIASRQFAIAEFLAGGQDFIGFGYRDDEQVRIAKSPVHADVAASIDDTRLARLKKKVKAMNAASTSFDEDDLGPVLPPVDE